MTTIVKRLAFAGALLFALYGSTLQAQVVVNGGFEDPGFVTGWNINNFGDMLLISGSTPFGVQHLEIGGLGGAVNNSIDQVVAGFTPGFMYRVDFATASQWANLDGSSGAEVEVSFLFGSTTAAATFFAPPVASWGLWNLHSYNFLATAPMVDIQFKQVTNGFDDIGIDNISISLVPEPSALVLGGLSVLGLGCVAMRRKYRRA